MDLLDFGLRPLSDHLPKETYSAVCENATRRVFSDGQALHARGDVGVRLSMIASGAARLGRYQQDGSFQLVAMLGPGGHFGDISMQRSAYTHDGYAVGNTETFVIGEALLEQFLRELPGFALALWRCNTSRLNALLELYDDARALSVPQRLAKVIYVHSGKGERPDGVACLQKDFAAILGVTEVSIGTALKELEKLGLIKTGYRFVSVPNKARLKSWLRKSGIS